MPRVKSFKLIPLLKKKSAFTLVELMVVVAVIGILSGIAVFNIPSIQKSARDSQRLSDLRQAQTILERVKAQVESYPLSNESYEIADHSWGSLWEEYNYRVPKDPLPSQKYVYVSDGQSYQLYAKFENPQSAQAFACASVCGPDGTYNGGVAGGVSSALISWETTPGSGAGGGGVGGGGTGTGGTGGTPSEPLAQGKQSFTVEGSGNPAVVSGDIDPLDPMVGANQSFSVRVRDTDPVTSVSVSFQTDNGLRSFPLSLTSGTELDGNWTESWVVTDTHNTTYKFTVRMTDAAGRTDQLTISLR